MTETKTIHCPGCQKPVVVSGQFAGFASFKMRCASCMGRLEIIVQPKVTATLIDSEESVPAHAASLSKVETLSL